MFEVSYETTFCSTHRLTREGRAIEPIHGHDWRVRSRMGADGGLLRRVRVWEAPGCSASYQE